MKKILMLFFSVILTSNVLATQPGDEEFGSHNYFCGYEKYKNKIPDACPRVTEITYGFTVYDNPALQEKMKSYLLEVIGFYKGKSKNNNILLKMDIPGLLSHEAIFNQNYYIHSPSEKTLIVNFFVKINNIDNKKLLTINIFMASNKLMKNTLVTSDLMAEGDLEGYVKGVADKYIRDQFAPTVFPDWNAN